MKDTFAPTCNRFLDIVVVYIKQSGINILRWWCCSSEKNKTVCVFSNKSLITVLHLPDRSHHVTSTFLFHDYISSPDRSQSQSPPRSINISLSRDLLMKKTQLAEQQLLSGQLPAQEELQAIAEQLEEEQQLPAQEEQQLPATVVLPAQEEQQLPATVVLPAQVDQQLPATATVPLPAQAEQQENVELPPQPQTLDAFTFSAWTTLYSNLEYLYRLYIGASYQRPLPIQAVGSNFDIHFNVGNFMFQLCWRPSSNWRSCD